MKSTKCCQTCINDERFTLSAPGCAESKNEAYENNGLNCEYHLMADDETLLFRFSTLGTYRLTLVGGKKDVRRILIDCHKCKYSVIHNGPCYERKVACMGFVERVKL